MKRCVSLALVFAASHVFAQSTSPPRFEVASVQVSQRPNPGMRGGILRGMRYELRNATMVDLIRTAYGISPEKIAGGPTWLEWNRWDIAALVPEGTPPARLREMLKALLADRFKLVVSEGTVTTTNLALRISSKHKLRSAVDAGGCSGQAAPDVNGIPLQTVACKGRSMAQLGELLVLGMRDYLPRGIQVVDATGLDGLWDFELKVHPRQALTQVGADAMSLDKALAEIGLKLEPTELQLPALVVESVTADFTPNDPDLLRRMPAPSPTFDVADVKLSPPGNARPANIDMQVNGLLLGQNVTLKTLIGRAWELPDEQYVTGPAWLDNNRYDVVARVYANTTYSASVQQDDDIARQMLRRLIIERFRMKYHLEDRLMSAYTLKSETLRMKRGDPTRRTRCFEGVPAASAAATRRPQFGRQVTCENVTMAQFGAWLPSIAGGYTRVAVRDLTGLTDSYTFTLDFSPIQQVRGPRSDSSASTIGIAPDPTGALSLVDALRAQLGIRMEEEKRMLPVMVIDSISPEPMPN